MNTAPLAQTRSSSSAAGHRSTRWLASGIVALLLGAAAVGLIAMGINRYRDGQWPEAIESLSRDSSLTWGSAWAVAGAIALVIIGLILLLLALLPGPRRNFVVPSDDVGEVRINAAGIARLVEHRIDSIDGVTNVRVRTQRGSIAVNVSTPLRDTAELRRIVKTTTEAVLQENLQPPLPRMNVNVRSLS